MEFSFRTKRLRKLFENDRFRLRELGADQSEKVAARRDDLAAAENLDVMRYLPGRCHELKGDRAGQLAVSLNEPYRLIFEPEHDPLPRTTNGGLDWQAVTAIRILDILDYHD